MTWPTAFLIVGLAGAIAIFVVVMTGLLIMTKEMKEEEEE